MSEKPRDEIEWAQMIAHDVHADCKQQLAAALAEIAALKAANSLFHDYETVHANEIAALKEPITDTYACQRCGRKDGLDAVLHDDDWALISDAAGGVNLLCLWCMDELALKLDIRRIDTHLAFCGKRLVSTDGTACAITVQRKEQAERDVEMLQAVATQACKERDTLAARVRELEAALSSLGSVISEGGQPCFCLDTPDYDVDSHHAPGCRAMRAALASATPEPAPDDAEILLPKLVEVQSVGRVISASVRPPLVIPDGEPAPDVAALERADGYEPMSCPKCGQVKTHYCPAAAQQPGAAGKDE